jgi:hypothetical protein
VTELHRIPTAKCQMLQILRAVVLAIVEDAVLRGSDRTIGSYIQSDRIHPDGFRYNSVTRNPIEFCQIIGSFNIQYRTC